MPIKQNQPSGWFLFYSVEVARTRTHFNATCRGHVAGRQLDGGHTLIKSSPATGTKSSVHNGFDRPGHSIFLNAPEPPLCKGRWAAERRLGGVVTCRENNPSVSFADSSLRRARSAALTVHRTVIHYRRLRFAYPLHKGAF